MKDPKSKIDLFEILSEELSKNGDLKVKFSYKYNVYEKPIKGEFTYHLAELAKIGRLFGKRNLILQTLMDFEEVGKFKITEGDIKDTGLEHDDFLKLYINKKHKFWSKLTNFHDNRRLIKEENEKVNKVPYDYYDDAEDDDDEDDF